MPPKIYLVMGKKGQWSDFRSWIVGAFPERGEADKFRLLLTEEWKKFYTEERQEQYDGTPFPLDPTMSAVESYAYELTYLVSDVPFDETVSMVLKRLGIPESSHVA